ncbi:complement C1q-like protein 3 [Anarhichas minor]|uniref:complement C1q-like protein 3 n=1 Tax=Anarhichas minor TaxID=65739 RepID=UPI003F732F0A
MKNIAVLILVFGCCVCQRPPHGNDDTLSLTSINQKVADNAAKITLLEAKLLNAEREVLELRSLTAGKPQVAFSAALMKSGRGNVGPFNTDTALKYNKVFSNTGNGYNPSTGIFTAHVSGTYFFRFSMFNNLSPTPNSVVSIMKNNERLVSVWDTSGTDSNDMGSNAVVIPLEEGDGVYVQLLATRVIYDDEWKYNTFTGFLLFAA